MVEMDHAALELEDDLFFADLSQRIALLIMDDDGGETEALRPQRPSSLQGLYHASLPAVPSLLFYEQAYGRQVRGTGVFIPQFSLPRRKQRAGKSRHSGGKPKVSAAAMGAETKSANRNGGRQQQQQHQSGNHYVHVAGEEIPPAGQERIKPSS
ncbi:hypothetical protein Taro_008626 [Colocasia esculenta]|uniref:Uncharacterized protein n=1 Tax=Colocasia esculenta TaxID=4460 RepID=A0A843U1P3_COLES|nr:hypothetical protein [Colocasia esculenta]